MAMNRVQFQAGLSMTEFLDRYGSEEQCEAALAAARWPEGFRCPACGAAEHGTFVRGRRRYWQCCTCRHQSSALCGTIFEATKLPLTRWFLAMHLLTQAKNNVSALELKRHLGVCYKSAWLMKHKLMEVMRLREDSRVLDGRVEIDDAYLGGERSGGKSGRGSENKVPFIAAVQTGPDGRPLYACLVRQPFTSEAVAIWAAKSLATSAQVVSDGLWCFRGVRIIGAEHEVTVTGGGKASARLPQFKAVNTLLGNLKTALSGTYHAFDFVKYAHRYLAEVQYRFNRRFNLASILARLLRAAALTPPRPAPIIRLAEVCH
ncbi:MAG: IS1595 family transposase [Rhodocyclaceae bacterium]|nr:IS1595 family transposase [Zoogloeaceae bacterium]MBV6412214.1 IS1595 family transposase ISBuba2 [Rhodocyclaceae bacterium]MCL4681377.1 IS1595 family transposase [Rhodocyclaceae bacterium]GIK20586.1 MAG: DDE transposase [Planctomycetota bacterium]